MRGVTHAVFLTILDQVNVPCMAFKEVEDEVPVPVSAHAPVVAPAIEGMHAGSGQVRLVADPGFEGSVTVDPRVLAKVEIVLEGRFGVPAASQSNAVLALGSRVPSLAHLPDRHTNVTRPERLRSCQHRNGAVLQRECERP